jgi:hypothetical protein
MDTLIVYKLCLGNYTGCHVYKSNDIFFCCKKKSAPVAAAFVT